MLTNRNEVDERLKMNENFLKSLEGIGGSRGRVRRSGAERERFDHDDGGGGGDEGWEEKEKENATSSSSAANDNNNNNNPTSRFSPLGFPPSPSSSSRGGAQGNASPSYVYNTPSLELSTAATSSIPALSPHDDGRTVRGWRGDGESGFEGGGWADGVV
jgi:hypothetical protein